MKEFTLKDGTIVAMETTKTDNFTSGTIIVNGHVEFFGDEIKQLIKMDQKLRTFNGTVIPETTRAVLYLCDFSDRKELKITSTICFDKVSEGTIVYSEIPNPESQLITGKTFEELSENLKRFHEMMKTEKFLENLRQSL